MGAAVHPDLIELSKTAARRRRARRARDLAFWAAMLGVTFLLGWLLGTGVG